MSEAFTALMSTSCTCLPAFLRAETMPGTWSLNVLLRAWTPESVDRIRVETRTVVSGADATIWSISAPSRAGAPPGL